MKKNHRIIIPVTAEEKKKIEKKAESCGGMTTAGFIRHICLMIRLKDGRLSL